MPRFRVPRVDGPAVLATGPRLVQRQGDAAVSPSQGADGTNGNNGNNGQGNETKASSDGVGPTVIVSAANVPQLQQLPPHLHTHTHSRRASHIAHSA